MWPFNERLNVNGSLGRRSGADLCLAEAKFGGAVQSPGWTLLAAEEDHVGGDMIYVICAYIALHCIAWYCIAILPCS